MDRRESLKSLLVGSLAGGLLLNGCTSEVENDIPVISDKSIDGYGRTPKEKLRDERLMSQQFFNEHELETIAVLADLILPATSSAGSATDAGVPEFVEFIAKDIPEHKIPLRGGIMWLDSYSNKSYNKEFTACDDSQQKNILDVIAYPDKSTPDVAQGVGFFSIVRNLTFTGYYTTKMGIEDLGYIGNSPNIWDGVPEEVLKEHGMSYDAEWLAKCVDQSKRNELAQWDEEGNLIN
jgi:hypothetical protein